MTQSLADHLDLSIDDRASICEDIDNLLCNRDLQYDSPVFEYWMTVLEDLGGEDAVRFWRAEAADDADRDE